MLKQVLLLLTAAALVSGRLLSVEFQDRGARDDGVHSQTTYVVDDSTGQQPRVVGVLQRYSASSVDPRAALGSLLAAPRAVFREDAWQSWINQQFDALESLHSTMFGRQFGEPQPLLGLATSSPSSSLMARMAASRFGPSLLEAYTRQQTQAGEEREEVANSAEGWIVTTSSGPLLRLSAVSAAGGLYADADPEQAAPEERAAQSERSHLESRSESRWEERSEAGEERGSEGPQGEEEGSFEAADGGARASLGRIFDRMPDSFKDLMAPVLGGFSDARPQGKLFGRGDEEQQDERMDGGAEGDDEDEEDADDDWDFVQMDVGRMRGFSEASARETEGVGGPWTEYSGPAEWADRSDDQVNWTYRDADGRPNWGLLSFLLLSASCLLVWLALIRMWCNLQRCCAGRRMCPARRPMATAESQPLLLDASDAKAALSNPLLLVPLGPEAALADPFRVHSVEVAAKHVPEGVEYCDVAYVPLKGAEVWRSHGRK